MLTAAILTALFVGFDAYVSHRRIKTYGPIAEVNMLVRQVITDFGLKTGVAVGIAFNVVILALLLHLQAERTLWFFAGAKWGLCLMQLKSLQMELFVERIIAKVRAKKAANP